jgi:hypothetical protein
MSRNSEPHDDDLDISLPRRQHSERNVIFVVLAVGATLLLLAVCVVGGGLFSVAWLVGEPDLGDPAAADPGVAAKLLGAWRGNFVMPGRNLDTIYTFNANGSFLEDSTDQFGNRLAAAGRWRLRNAQEVEIHWNNGGIEIAAIHLRDDGGLDYRIIHHTDAGQIGVASVMKRH